MGRVLQCLCIIAMISSVLSRSHQPHLDDRGVVKRSISVDNGPQITKECEKRGFCIDNEVMNYPEKFAEELILEGKVPVRIESSDELDAHIGNRLGPDSTKFEIPICAARRQIIYPKSLPDKGGVHHFVVNSEKHPVQGFYVELCELDEKTEEPLSCSGLIEFKPGYKSTGCMQKYIYKVFDIIEGGKTVGQKKLMVPSCCTCAITRS